MALISILNNPEAQGTSESDTIYDVDSGRRTLGLGGNDQIFGEGGNDEIFGNEGNDSIFGGLGEDSLYGGRGDDVIYGRVQLGTGESNSNFLFGNLGKDTLWGSAGNDQLFGGRDNDYLYGDLGDDFLSGDLGFDVLVGSVGTDTLAISPLADNSFDYITDFKPGEDVIRLGGGLTFDNLVISTLPQAGLVARDVEKNFSGLAPFTFKQSDLVIRIKGSGQILAVLDFTGTSPFLTPQSLTPESFTV